MTSSIKNIQSNSRLIKVEMSDTPGEARVSFSTQSAGLLSDSLIVFVELEDPHKPCGRVQMNEAGRKTVMAAFYPQLKLAEESITVQTEMIFIVDRSGSMAGSRIRKVTETLQIFLRSLTEGILFNIVGFGSKTEHLFPMGSVEYNDTYAPDLIRAGLGSDLLHIILSGILRSRQIMWPILLPTLAERISSNLFKRC